MKITKVETLEGKIVCRARVVDDEVFYLKLYNEKEDSYFVFVQQIPDNVFHNLKDGDEVLLECEPIHLRSGLSYYQLKLTDGLVTVVEEIKEIEDNPYVHLINDTIEALTKERDYYKTLYELLKEDTINQHKSTKP